MLRFRARHQVRKKLENKRERETESDEATLFEYRSSMCRQHLSRRGKTEREKRVKDWKKKKRRRRRRRRDCCWTNRYPSKNRIERCRVLG